MSYIFCNFVPRKTPKKMSRFNHRNKWTQRDYIVRYLSVTAIIVLLVAFMPRERVRTYYYHEGGVWDYATLIAKDSFPVLKSETQLQKEKDSIVHYYEPYFNYDANKADSMIAEWHKVFKTSLAQHVPAHFEKHITTRLMEIYDNGIVSGEDYNLVNTQHANAIRVIKGNVSAIRPTNEIYSPKTAYEELMQMADSTMYRREDLLKCNLNDFLTANLSYDSKKSEQQLMELESMITPYIGQVIVGQKIVDRGEIIGPNTFLILESMMQHMGEKEKSTTEILLTLLWQTIYTGLIVILLLLYFQQFRNDYLASTRSMLLTCTLSILFPLLAFTLVGHGIGNPYMLPYCITPIFMRIFMDSRTAFITHLMMILLCAVAVPRPADFIIIETLAGLTAIITLRELTQRSELVSAILAVLGVSILTYVCLQFLNDKALFVEDADYTDLYNIIASSLLLMISYLLLIPIERIFGFTSNVTLIELSNANNPLLRSMSEQAPGTFQHSMQVANLAAAVAEKLGAKSQLVRTGALYHDIGKIRHAAFFTENQKGMNPHDRLTETQSAQIIISHVREGVALAEKNKLPQVIRDFIATHHGRSMTKYFYIQACNKCPEKEVDPANFTYDGPEPQTMEQAILMMCDAVEAASRSLKDITEESISDLVNKIVESQLADGHFREAPITFQDIESAKEVLKDKLRTIYHTRVQYPELKK